jgi:hypothetical protein
VGSLLSYGVTYLWRPLANRAGRHIQRGDTPSFPTPMEAPMERDDDFGLEVVRRRALHAFDERLRSVPVADIAFDSFLHEWFPGAAFMPEVYSRWLRWETPSLAVEGVIAQVGNHVRLWLRLQPPFPAIIDVRGQHRVSKVRTDDSGSAGLTAPRGLVSFVVASAQRVHEPCLQTAWVTL